MPSLDRPHSDRILQRIAGVEQLLTEVDEAGAEELLDELYMLITKLFEQFPQLDKED